MLIPGFCSSGSSAKPLLLAALLLLVAGCRPAREVAPGPDAWPPLSRETPTGYTHYRVISEESELRALVYRDGPMARLGHNHVLSSRALQGDILLSNKSQEPRISLVLPVASFSVDQAELRAEEGDDFLGAVAADASTGTRTNLLSEALLDGTRFPEIRLTSRSVTGQAPDFIVTVAVNVKGHTHDLQVPVRVEQAIGEVRATGAFSVTHAELGLSPFKVMGGLLSVQDEIRLRFRIVARPWHTDSP